MTKYRSNYIEVIMECETAIGRIRELIAAGHGSSEEAGALFEQVRIAVSPRLMGYIRRTGWLSPLLAEEALERMYERLFHDIWSVSFGSLERHFGAYLKAMPVRVLATMRRRHLLDGKALPERMERPVAEEGLLLGEVTPDRAGEVPYEMVDLRELLLCLPADEREMLLLRARGVSGKEIACQRGISDATVSRIWWRAGVRLRRWLEHPEEASRITSGQMTSSGPCQPSPHPLRSCSRAISFGAPHHMFRL